MGNQSDEEEVKKELNVPPKMKPKKLDAARLKVLFEKEINVDNKTNDTDINFVSIGTVFIIVHIIGVLIMSSPSTVTHLGVKYGFSTDQCIYVGFYDRFRSTAVLAVFCHYQILQKKHVRSEHLVFVRTRDCTNLCFDEQFFVSVHF